MSIFVPKPSLEAAEAVMSLLPNLPDFEQSLATFAEERRSYCEALQKMYEMLAAIAANGTTWEQVAKERGMEMVIQSISDAELIAGFDPVLQFYEENLDRDFPDEFQSRCEVLRGVYKTIGLKTDRTWQQVALARRLDGVVDYLNADLPS